MNRFVGFLLAVFAVFVLTSCGGGGGVGSGGSGHLSNGKWAGTFKCKDHFPLTTFHELWVEFEVENRVIVAATSVVKYEYDGYVGQNVGQISGEFWIGPQPFLLDFDIAQLPGYGVKHTIQKLICTSPASLETDGNSPPNRIFGELSVQEWDDFSQIDYTSADWDIDITRQTK